MYSHFEKVQFRLSNNSILVKTKKQKKLSGNFPVVAMLSSNTCVKNFD